MGPKKKGAKKSGKKGRGAELQNERWILSWAVIFVRVSRSGIFVAQLYIRYVNMIQVPFDHMCCRASCCSALGCSKKGLYHANEWV